MGKIRRSKKQDKQPSLFDQAMFKPVDIQREPPAKAKADEVKVRPEGAFRPKIAIARTRSCPICGEHVRIDPDGIVRCTQCWWWQGLSEKFDE